LGGKSINGNISIFPYPDSVPYHLYWQVLNAKKHGVPQNRERVFLVGIRDDEDNNFRFPMEEQLTTRLKDVLESNVADKYFLSEEQCVNISRLKETLQKHQLPNEIRMIDSYNKTIHEDSICISARINASSSTHLSIPGNQSQDVIVHNIPEMVKVRKHEVDIVSLQNCLKEHRTKSIKEIAIELNVPKTEVEHWFRTDKYFGIPNAEIWFDLKKCLNITTTDFDLSITEFIEKEGVFEKSNRVYDADGLAPTMTSTSADERILVKNDFQQDEEIWVADFRNDEGLRIRKDNISPCMAARKHSETDVSTMPPIIGAFRGRNPENPSDCTNGSPTEQRLEINNQGTSNAITTVQKDNVVIMPLFHWGKGKNNERMVYDKEGISPCMTSAMGTGGGYTPSVVNNYKIRRLTPRECFRLMDSPDTFTWPVSDSQAYKQAGNSIVVNVLYKILLQITKKLRT
jgi:DNA (cytosine-5)-methyltransferase 1